MQIILKYKSIDIKRYMFGKYAESHQLWSLSGSLMSFILSEIKKRNEKKKDYFIQLLD